MPKTLADYPRTTQSIAYAASITPDATAGEVITVGTLTGGITINAPTNPATGQFLEFLFLQDGVGGWAVTWNAVFKTTWVNTGNTANLYASVTFEYNGTNWVQVSAQQLWTASAGGAPDPHGFASHIGAIQPPALWTWRITPAAISGGGVESLTFTATSPKSWEIVQDTTGATSGSVASHRLLAADTAAWGHNGVGSLRAFQFLLSVGQSTAQRFHLYVSDENIGVGTEPSTTVRHLGIRVADGFVYFVSADGTTEQATDVSTWLTLDDTRRMCMITYDGTSAKLYVGGVLRATNSTKVPSAVATTTPQFYAWLTNTAAASKIMRFGHLVVWGALP